MELLGIINMDFDIIDQLQIRYSAFDRYWGKHGNTFIDFKKAYDSDRWEALYNIFIIFGIPMKCKGN
jgi:hypothetical protein